MKNNNDKNGKNDQIDKKIKMVKIGMYIAIGIVIIAMGIMYFVKENKLNEDKSIAYTQLIQDISENKISKIELTQGSSKVKVIYKQEQEKQEQENVQINEDKENLENINKDNEESLIKVEEQVEDLIKNEKLEKEEEENAKTSLVPDMDAFITFVQEQKLQGNDIYLIQNERSFFVTLSQNLISFLPTLIMLAMVVMIFKMNGLGDKGKVYDQTQIKTKVKFDDVAGLDEEKEEMIEIVDFLKNPDKYEKMGAKVPKGVLLYGKPGTGKTLIAKAIAGEANVPFISMSGSEFIEMFAGLGASRVRKLFEKARKLAPCIIFIDEIDAIGSRRTGNSGAESENNQTLNQLLVEMDGFDSNETIIVIAATNRPEMLDKALLRPGRFDRQITVPAPDKTGRLEILKIHSKDKNLEDDINLEEIAEDTAGLTGAELENILNEAAIIATKRKHNKISNDDIDEAVKKVTVGLEKTSRKYSKKDKALTAFHEAGHAVVSQYLPTQTPVKEISIVPRGMAGGYTMYETKEDKYYISKQEMLEKLVALLGGRAGEKIALNDISTGASNDIEVATQIAKEMVTKYGMSEKVGPIDLQTSDENQMAYFGEELTNAVGSEVRTLIDWAYEMAQQILIEHRDKLDIIANTLIEKEKISKKEFDEIFGNHEEDEEN